MNAALDSESLGLLQSSLDRYAADHYSFQARRTALESAEAFSRQAWRDYARFGWLAIPLPAESGGFDGAPDAIAALMRFVGEALVLEPVFASSVLCGRLLSRLDDPAARTELDALAGGSTIWALAHAEVVADAADTTIRSEYRDGRLQGAKTVVLHGDVCTRLLVSACDVEHGGTSLLIVDPAASGVHRDSYRLLDGRGAASFRFDAAAALPVGPRGGAAALIDDALDEARLAMCAEAHGAIRALNRLTNEYLKARKQFGRAIGTNQALQHRMVDLFILEEEVRAVTSAAQRALRGPEDERRRAIHGALAHTIAAGRQVSHEAVQMHGGIGMTDELSVSHYFKRLMVIGRLLGDRSEHLKRFAELPAVA